MESYVWDSWIANSELEKNSEKGFCNEFSILCFFSNEIPRANILIIIFFFFFKVDRAVPFGQKNEKSKIHTIVLEEKSSIIQY